MVNTLWIGLLEGLLVAIIILGTRWVYAIKHNEQFFVIKKDLTPCNRKKREVNLYTWNIFGILIGLLFIITCLVFKGSFAAVSWGYFIGFLILFMGIGGTLLLIQELKKG